MTGGEKPHPFLDKMGSFFPITLYSMIIGLGGLMFGYDIGTIGAMIETKSFVFKYGNVVVDNKRAFSAFVKGSLLGIACLGACSGSLLGNSICPQIGYRRTIFVGYCCYIVGGVGLIFSSTWYFTACARFVIGNANGLICTMCPMLISELAPNYKRGMYVSFHQLFTTVGILLGACTVLFSTYANSEADDNQFKYPICLSVVLSIIGALLIWIVPESPIWLLKKGRVYDACLSLSWAKDLPVDDKSIVYCILEYSMNAEPFNAQKDEEGNKDKKTGPSIAVAEIRHQSMRKQHSIRYGQPKYLQRTLAGVVLFLFQQFTGVNYFFYYSTIIFSKVDLSSPYIVPVILGSVNLVFSIIALSIVSKTGRRVLLITGSVLMLVLMLVFTSVGITIQDTILGTLLMVISACVFIGSFALTWGPVTQVLISEMFPLDIKVKATAISGMSCWIFNFTISMMVPILTEYIGFGLGYVFSFFLLLSIPFVYYVIPETRNRTIQQIDAMYADNTT